MDIDIFRNAQLEAKKRELDERIVELKSLIAQYEEKINEYNRQIYNNESENDSLNHMRKTVEMYREEYAIGKANKENAMEQVLAVSQNNVVAKEYYQGMKKVLSGLGTKIATEVFETLLNRLRNEIDRSASNVNNAREKVNYYRRLKESAQIELDGVIQARACL